MPSLCPAGEMPKHFSMDWGTTGDPKTRIGAERKTAKMRAMYIKKRPNKASNSKLAKCGQNIPPKREGTIKLVLNTGGKRSVTLRCAVSQSANAFCCLCQLAICNAVSLFVFAVTLGASWCTDLREHLCLRHRCARSDTSIVTVMVSPSVFPRQLMKVRPISLIVA